ncbi:MAG: hypothetical protein RBG13Loki_2037 [Promethearchaeota archaeon CR_4]|nr:MAG: hypothetical protein RBG13Loki_2037 [Candidatus Lokiarchaeota archaeon CR_4]
MTSTASIPAPPIEGGILGTNDVATVLGEIRTNYGKLVRAGRIHGLMICDADARVLATDPLFDQKISTWDLAALAAAAYGVAKQARLFFDALGAKELERGSLVFDGLQLFIAQAGSISGEKAKSKEILLVTLADKDANFGLIILQMRKYAPRVQKAICNAAMRQNLDIPERELHTMIETAKSGGLFKKTM